MLKFHSSPFHWYDFQLDKILLKNRRYCDCGIASTTTPTMTYNQLVSVIVGTPNQVCIGDDDWPIGKMGAFLSEHYLSLNVECCE